MQSQRENWPGNRRGNRLGSENIHLAANVKKKKKAENNGVIARRRNGGRENGNLRRISGVKPISSSIWRNQPAKSNVAASEETQNKLS